MQNGSKRRKTDATPTICVLGATGVGKGSTLNSCFRETKFGTSSLFASDTIKPASFVLPWRGTGEPMRGVDLCGFSDSEGRDTGFIEAMVKYLREEVRHVNCFLLLLNSQEPRLGVHLKDMLLALKGVFGLAFMRNVVIGFTRWDYTRRGEVMRRGVTREALMESVNGLLRSLLGHTEDDCPCVFLDNTINMCSEDELRDLYTCRHCHNCSDELQLVTSAFDDALEAIRRAAVDNEPFQCGQIEGILAERDVGRDKLERENAAISEGDEAFERFKRLWEDVEVDSPESLDSRVQASSASAREQLVLFLAAKCKPDLEHVMASVLGDFDWRMREMVNGLTSRNKNAAASFNRALRMRLVREYKECIRKQVEGGEGNTSTPRQRFESVHAEYKVLIQSFLESCKGGPLSWPPLSVLQDQLRMEQVDAREKILRDDLRAGNELPSLSVALKDATAVVKLLGEPSVPAWLRERAR